MYVYAHVSYLYIFTYTIINMHTCLYMDRGKLSTGSKLKKALTKSVLA